MPEINIIMWHLCCRAAPPPPGTAHSNPCCGFAVNDTEGFSVVCKALTTSELDFTGSIPYKPALWSAPTEEPRNVGHSFETYSVICERSNDKKCLKAVILNI